jgi:beta-lactamase regulating signal transducer with metallopeptidase domain
MSTITMITLGFIWVLVVFILWASVCIKYFRARKARNEKSSEKTTFQRAICKMAKNKVIYR